MKKIVIILVAGITLLATGCSGYIALSVDEGYKKYLDSPKSPKVERMAARGSISITVVSPENCGCYLEKTNEKKEISEAVPLQCIGFPILTEDPGKEIKSKVKDDNAKSRAFYVFESFGLTVKSSFERHLQAYFSDVKVNLVSQEQAGRATSSVMSYYTKFAITDDKVFLTKMIAVSDQGKTFEGLAKVTDKMGNSNLAWYVPISLVFFPLGYAICTIILNNKYMDVMIRTMAWSVDQAAADLSSKIAGSVALNPDQNFTVYVLLE